MKLKSWFIASWFVANLKSGLEYFGTIRNILVWVINLNNILVHFTQSYFIYIIKRSRSLPNLKPPTPPTVDIFSNTPFHPANSNFSTIIQPPLHPIPLICPNTRVISLPLPLSSLLHHHFFLPPHQLFLFDTPPPLSYISPNPNSFVLLENFKHDWYLPAPSHQNLLTFLLTLLISYLSLQLNVNALYITGKIPGQFFCM